VRISQHKSKSTLLVCYSNFFIGLEGCALFWFLAIFDFFCQPQFLLKKEQSPKNTQKQIVHTSKV